METPVGTLNDSDLETLDPPSKSRKILDSGIGTPHAVTQAGLSVLHLQVPIRRSVVGR